MRKKTPPTRDIICEQIRNEDDDCLSFCPKKHACLQFEIFPLCGVTETTDTCLFVKPEPWCVNCAHLYKLNDNENNEISLCYCELRRKLFEQYDF